MIRGVVSGLCVARVLGTGEHGALMQSQANTEDLDSILFESGSASERPRSKSHSSHSVHERNRARLMELQNNAQMLEKKYKAILHAKVEKTEKTEKSSHRQEAHVAKRDANEWAPKEAVFSTFDTAIQTMRDALKREKARNQENIDEAEDALISCNMERRDEFDLPRYMDYYVYMETIKHFCRNFESCWSVAKQNWDSTSANVRLLEVSQKDIWEILKKAECFVTHIRKEDPTQVDFNECVNLNNVDLGNAINTTVLDIDYPVTEKDVCDICSMQKESYEKRSTDALEKAWRVRHHNKPRMGIMNTAKAMYEMLKKRGFKEQHEEEQQAIVDANTEVGDCNRAKEKTWTEEDTDDKNTRMTDARGAHDDCRVDEHVHLTWMQENCTSFRQARGGCATTRDASTRGSWAYWWSDTPVDGVDHTAARDDTVEKGKKCHSEITRTNPISQNCDLKQREFEQKFCTYFKSKNQTCWDLDTCNAKELADRDAVVEHVQAREHSLQLQHRLIEINLCFIDLYQGAEDAVTAADLSHDDLEKCLDKEVNIEHLEIDYIPAPVKAACPTDDIQYYPGQEEWEEDEYSGSPFVDKWNSMNSIEECTHPSTGLIQKMKPRRPGASASMRSP